MKDYWPRVAEVHYKDAPAHLRGNKVVAVPKSGPESGGHGWFRNLGGDVDRPIPMASISPPSRPS